MSADFTRKMLETIRHLNDDEKEVINKITEGETSRLENTTSQMLNEIRKLMAESDNNNNNGVPVTDEFGERGLSGQKKAISSALQSNINFDDNCLIFYPNDNDIVFSGTIADLNGLKWQFRFNDPSGTGCYIWTGNGPIQLNNNTMDKLNKLSGYYKNWRQDIITHNLVEEWKSQIQK